MSGEDEAQGGRVREESSALDEVLVLGTLGAVDAIDHLISQPRLKAGLKGDRGTLLGAGGTRSLDHEIGVLLSVVPDTLATGALESLFNFKFKHFRGALAGLGNLLSLLHLIQEVSKVLTGVLLLSGLELFMVFANESLEQLRSDSFLVEFVF